MNSSYMKTLNGGIIKVLDGTVVMQIDPPAVRSFLMANNLPEDYIKWLPLYVEKRHDESKIALRPKCS